MIEGEDEDFGNNKGLSFYVSHIVYYNYPISMSQITASRMYPIPWCRNMQLYKQKIAAAKKGHELLKRKADALKKKFK